MYRRIAVDLVAPDVDFNSFDRDGDGTISKQELIIFLIIATKDADPDGKGANTNATNRGTKPSCFIPKGSNVSICPSIGSASEHASFASVAHELSHSLGTKDNYGPWSFGLCLNNRATLMECTVGGARDAPDRTDQYVHLDPWHKLQFAWQEPRIADLAEPFGCQSLRAPNTKPWIDERHRTILLYDSGRGTSEYFLLEYRNPRADGGGYDENVAETGLAVWHVMTDSSGDLKEIPLGIGPGEDKKLNSKTSGDDVVVGDVLLWGTNQLLESKPSGDGTTKRTILLNVYGAPAGKLGSPTFWGSDLMPMRLQWFDGTDAGVDIEAANSSSSSPLLDVYWLRDDAGFPKNLDDLSAAQCYSRVTGDIDVNPALEITTLSFTR